MHVVAAKKNKGVNYGITNCINHGRPSGKLFLQIKKKNEKIYIYNVNKKHKNRIFYMDILTFFLLECIVLKIIFLRIPIPKIEVKNVCKNAKNIYLTNRHTDLIMILELPHSL